MRVGHLNNVTIVIVEDHGEIRSLITTFLTSQGASVVATANAFDGLAAVKHCRPDVVLTDINLPGRDGFLLLQDIRAIVPEAEGRMPVIAITALGNATARHRMLAAGFRRHLAKPFTPTQLLQTIQSVLKD
jgi:CheY-like chemotaxis protein